MFGRRGPTNEELHEFAARLGMRRAWFQQSASSPHYDLVAKRRAVAVELGAVELDDRAFCALTKRWRTAARVALAAVRAHLYR